jgi:hypothetical protein
MHNDRRIPVKILRAFTLLIILLVFPACNSDDAVTSASFSIESEINGAKPYHYVFIISPTSGHWIFERGGVSPNNPFTDAYADHGYMIVVLISGKQYFNLALAKDISVQPDPNGSTITLRY